MQRREMHTQAATICSEQRVARRREGEWYAEGWGWRPGWSKQLHSCGTLVSLSSSAWSCRIGLVLLERLSVASRTEPGSGQHAGVAWLDLAGAARAVCCGRVDEWTCERKTETRDAHSNYASVASVVSATSAGLAEVKHAGTWGSVGCWGWSGRGDAEKRGRRSKTIRGILVFLTRGMLSAEWVSVSSGRGLGLGAGVLFDMFRSPQRSVHLSPRCRLSVSFWQPGMHAIPAICAELNWTELNWTELNGTRVSFGARSSADKRWIWWVTAGRLVSWNKLRCDAMRLGLDGCTGVEGYGLP